MPRCSVCLMTFHHSAASASRNESRCSKCRKVPQGSFGVRYDITGRATAVVARCGRCGAQHTPSVAALRRRDYRCPDCVKGYTDARRTAAPPSRLDRAALLSDPAFVASQEAERNRLKLARKPADNNP